MHAGDAVVGVGEGEVGVGEGPVPEHQVVDRSLVRLVRATEAAAQDGLEDLRGGRCDEGGAEGGGGAEGEERGEGEDGRQAERR